MNENTRKKMMYYYNLFTGNEGSITAIGLQYFEDYAKYKHYENLPTYMALENYIMKDSDCIDLLNAFAADLLYYILYKVSELKETKVFLE